MFRNISSGRQSGLQILQDCFHIFQISDDKVDNNKLDSLGNFCTQDFLVTSSGPRQLLSMVESTALVLVDKVFWCGS